MSQDPPRRLIVIRIEATPQTDRVICGVGGLLLGAGLSLIAWAIVLGLGWIGFACWRAGQG